MPSKPAILVVDDDAEVLRAIARDLRRQYGEAYRVLRAASGEEALDAVRDLDAKGDPIALFLSDQRMPGMSGVEFLEEATALFPDAKRVLLTAYADTEAAIRAINRARTDYYLMKPWDPPEELLYPILDDLLEDWKLSFRPAYSGVRVVGDRWSPETYAVKDFLARNLVPYKWLDVERSDEARALLEQHGGRGALPLVLFPDGDSLQKPTPPELGEKLGLQMTADREFYDLVIVGGGPAGLAAAVYGASEGLKTVLVEREAPGGQAGTSSRIENYLGFPSGLSGAELTRRAVAQARKFEAEVLAPVEATGLRAEDGYHLVSLSNGNEIACHALMIASGVQYKTLDAPGFDALTGRGIYYGAAMAEAMACRDERVFIIGAGNSAGQAAMYFARYAAHVTMLVRGGDLGKSMSQYLIDQIEATDIIEVLLNTEAVEAKGADRLEALTLKNSETGEVKDVETSTVFIFIGAAPHTDWLGDVLVRDERGFIVTGPDLKNRYDHWPLDRDPFLLETCRPGVFAVGDVRHGSVKRVASGVGEGSVAISFVHQHLATL